MLTFIVTAVSVRAFRDLATRFVLLLFIQYLSFETQA